MEDKKILAVILMLLALASIYFLFTKSKKKQKKQIENNLASKNNDVDKHKLSPEKEDNTEKTSTSAVNYSFIIVAISANIATFLFQVLVVKEDFFNSLMIIVFVAIVIPVLGDAFVNKWTFKRLYRNWSLVFLVLVIISHLGRVSSL
tara:strand:+ start:589 stop:1029 length:441 start_codon:yes stop_codon:yes gene_type:complete